jgi:hypothetical protein
MGRISEEAKRKYHKRVEEYKAQIEGFRRREEAVLKVIDQRPEGAAQRRLALADERLNLASLFLLLNRISQSMLSIKNDDFLNNARKSCYSSIIYLEQVVTDFLDAPFSEYAEHLEQIDSLSTKKRYQLIRKLGFTIDSVKDGFGENNKWRWSFVELEGRFAVVAKNILDLRSVIAGLDPRAEGYEERLAHVRLVKDRLKHSGERYRERFELSTNRIDDIKKGIDFLNALKRIHTLLGEPQLAEEIKRRAEVWKSRMEDEERKTEASRSQSR